MVEEHRSKPSRIVGCRRRIDAVLTCARPLEQCTDHTRGFQVGADDNAQRTRFRALTRDTHALSIQTRQLFCGNGQQKRFSQ
jgi:hypothetical protein